MELPIPALEDFIEQHGIHAEIGVILGTGLGKLVDEISIIQEIPYADIPNFVEATVESHSGKLLFGNIAGKKAIIMQGRFHFYEGYDYNQVVMPVNLMKAAGVQYILISNAAGAINPQFKKGRLMVLTDHINLQPGTNPFESDADKLNLQSRKICSPYDNKINSLIFKIALKQNLDIYNGVYVSVPGPMLETRAEYRYLRRIGADAVGMSTVPEVLSALQSGIRCCAVSVLTDECDPDNLEEVNIADIIEVAQKSDKQLAGLFKELIAEL